MSSAFQEEKACFRQTCDWLLYKRYTSEVASVAKHVAHEIRRKNTARPFVCRLFLLPLFRAMPPERVWKMHFPNFQT
ncbi:MAG: hypothetical protein K1Y36_30990, partial [Blastocatellia bacterium]|nr:hypothetical protein [Blastocatellia bacterium]